MVESAEIHQIEYFDLAKFAGGMEEVLTRAASVIGSERICVVATDTTYALAVSVESRVALERLELLKGRPVGQPFSIAVANLRMARQYAHLSLRESELMSKLLPGRITVIVAAKPGLEPGIVSEGKIAIRIPDRMFVRSLSRACGVGLTATSANLRGLPPAHSVGQFLSQLHGNPAECFVGGIIDEGVLPPSEVSTIIDITTDAFRIVREGCVSAASITTMLRGD